MTTFSSELIVVLSVNGLGEFVIMVSNVGSGGGGVTALQVRVLLNNGNDCNWALIFGGNNPATTVLSMQNHFSSMVE